STEGVQNELLKIVEDGTFYIDFSKNGMQAREKINTANITFVGVGAFNGMLTEIIEKQMGFGNNINTREVVKEKIVPDADTEPLRHRRRRGRHTRTVAGRCQRSPYSKSHTYSHRRK
ncbi:MAG: AAA family ATPase, partial [Selenomonadales bacterium]|nr:AAA family ATPase [Selenomonadales bacterium]